MSAFALEFELTAEEVEATHDVGLGRLQAAVPPPGGILTLVTFAAYFVATLALMLHLGLSGASDTVAVVAALTLPFLLRLAAETWLGHRHGRAVIAAERAYSPYFAGVRRITLDEDGVRVLGRDGVLDTFTSWRFLTAAEEAKGLVLLWYGHTHAHMLPIRAFRDRAEAGAALAFARARIGGRHAAGGSVPSIPGSGPSRPEEEAP